jgi:ribosomal protein S18 acetylase RimI-like enzyme
MSDAIEVRRLGEDDLDGLLELYAHLHENDDPAAERETLQRVWRELCRDDRTLYFGAEADGRLVSTCIVTIIPNLTHGARPYAVLENFVTHESYRRRGFGRAVMVAIIEHCKAAGCHKIMLTSAATRHAAHALYESLGFKSKSNRAFVYYM